MSNIYPTQKRCVLGCRLQLQSRYLLLASDNVVKSPTIQIKYGKFLCQFNLTSCILTLHLIQVVRICPLWSEKSSQRGDVQNQGQTSHKPPSESFRADNPTLVGSTSVIDPLLPPSYHTSFWHVYSSPVLWTDITQNSCHQDLVSCKATQYQEATPELMVCHVKATSRLAFPSTLFVKSLAGFF